MNDPMLPLPGLSPIAGKAVVAKFDGGLLSSDGGVLALREVEKRLRVADRFAACIKDPRAPDHRPHSIAQEKSKTRNADCRRREATGSANRSAQVGEEPHVGGEPVLGGLRPGRL